MFTSISYNIKHIIHHSNVLYICTAPSVAPSNFQAVNITSTSITFSWDALVDQANGIIQFYVITCISDDKITVVVSDPLLD